MAGAGSVMCGICGVKWNHYHERSGGVRRGVALDRGGGAKQNQYMWSHDVAICTWIPSVIRSGGETAGGDWSGEGPVGPTAAGAVMWNHEMTGNMGRSVAGAQTESIGLMMWPSAHASLLS